MSDLPSPDEYLSQMGTATGPAPSTYEEDLAHRQASDIAYRTQLATPDEAARANAIARDRGIPSVIVRSNLPAYEAQQRGSVAAKMARDYPAIGRWASDPRNAEVAADDYDSLGVIGKAFYGFKNFAGSLKAGSFTALGGLYGTIAAASELEDRYSPLAWIERQAFGKSGAARSAEAARFFQKTDTDAAKAARPQVDNWLAKNLLKGVESLPLTATAVGAGMIGGPGVSASIMAGSAGGNEYIKARDAGLSPERSALYGAAQGSVEFITEKIPASRLLNDLAAKSPIGKTLLRQLAAEIPGEQVATVLQDLNEWATLNPEKTLGDFLKARPAAAAETLAATIGGVGTTVGVTMSVDRTARALVKVARPAVQAEAAADHGAMLDQVTAAVAQSKTGQRDGDALASLLREMAGDHNVENAYIPAEAINAYMQMDGYDGSFDDYREAVYEGMASGGDVVLPFEVAVTKMAKSWDVFKDDIRLTPGGMSRKEAQTFDESMADVMADLTDKMEVQQRDDAAAMVPRDKLLQSVTDKLMDAGFTPTIARQQAELLTQRAATRSTRMGAELTGGEYDGLAINQVLPEKLAQAQKADEVDIVINAMKKGAVESKPSGPTLLAWLAQNGGIEDKGGDITAMGGDKWHVGKPGKRKLIRPHEDAVQGSMLPGSGVSDYSPDYLAQRAWDEGYFPHHAERPSIDELFALIDAELRGTQTHAETAGTNVAKETQDRVAEAANELRAMLENRGIDADTATAKEIRAAMQGYAAERAAGAGFEQSRADKNAWVRSVDAIIRGDNVGSGPVKVGATPHVLQMLGFGAGDMVMMKAKIARARRDHPDVPLSVWHDLPDLLSDPRAAFPSRRDDGSVVVAVDARDASGRPVIVPVIASEKDGTVVLSVYGKDDGDAFIRTEITAAQNAGQDVYIREGLADALAKKPGEPASHAPIASEVTAKPERKILSLKDKGKSFNQPAYHGSPHIFDKFSTDAMGTGEGAQVYGWGLYFAGKKEVAEAYRKKIKDMGFVRDVNARMSDLAKVMSRDAIPGQYGKYRTPEGLAAKEEYDTLMDARSKRLADPGRLYEVDIPEDDEYLLWDKPLSEHPDEIREQFAWAWQEAVLAVQQERARQGIENPEAYNPTIPENAGEAYQRLGQIMHSEKAASLALKDLGVAGIKYLDGSSRGDGDGTHNYVVFDDSRVSIQAYEQSFADGPRGRIVFPVAGFGTGPTIIDLFQSRDQSTFLHETGHLWLEELRQDVSDPEAPDQLRADWQAVQDWFAANGNPIVDGIIPVEAHEMWARGVERYLMEGKAPVPALRKAFAAFKSWLVAIYRTVDKLKSPVTDDIRAVMDRLIATDEEIAQAREEQNLEAAFTEKPATMSDAEWQDYQTITTGAREMAHDTLLAKVMASIKRRVTKEYKERQAEVRTEVEVEIDSRPEFKALRNVRATPLDAAWLREAYGPDAGAMLPKSVPPVYKDGGANADEVAEMSGFKSGDEMVRALMGVETRRLQLREGGDKRSVREVLIAQETETRLNERYGDPFTDGSIEEEALAAVHNEKQGEVLAADLRIIARSTGDKPTPYRVAKAWAARTVREGIVNDVISRSSIQRYRRAASKAGKAGTDAILAGDMAEAFRQKQAQMLNNALVSEAQKVADEVEKAVARLEKWAKRSTIKSVDQDYLERAQALLEQVELRPRTQRSIDRQAQFEAWAAEQEAEGHDMVVPPSFAASLGTTHWTRLPVDQLLGLDAAVDQIIFLGRKKQTYLDNKIARDRETVIQEALAQNDGAKRTPPVNGFMEPGYFDRAKTFVLGIDAAMLKVETIIDWLDARNPNGVYNRIVFQPLVEAQEARRVLMKDKLAKIEAARLLVPTKTRKRWGDKIVLDFIDPETGQQAVLTRDQLIVMALNMGNEGNASKLAGGYGWNEGAILDMLNRELTAPEWQFVQSTWDIIDEFWPAAAAMERRVNGVEPDKVEAREVSTPAGVIRGGYFPVSYDPTRNLEVEKQKTKDGAKLFEGGYKRPNTKSGSLSERTALKTRPVDIRTLGIINQHVVEMAHDITHREALMTAYRFLNEPRIVREVREVLNTEIQKQFNPWLDHIAKEWVSDTTGMVHVTKFVKNLRTNATFVGMAYRVSTGMMQVAGVFNSAERIGARHVVDGINSFIRHPIETMNFVLDNSNEVRARMETMDRDIQDAIRKETGKLGFLSDVKRYGYLHIGYIDRFVSVITWLGAYNKALGQNMDDAQAMAFGDKAVRQSQGSGAAKDLAAVQRGKGAAGEATKLLTMFYSYMSAFYQRQRTLNRDYGAAIKGRNIGDFPELLARTMFLYFFPALVSELLAGRWPEEDEEWGTWALQKVGLSALGPIPFLRDVVGGAASGFGYNFTPASGLGRTAVNLWKDGARIWEGEETKRATRDVIEFAGYMGAPVSGQIAASTQFLVDVSHGEQDPQDFGDWWEGLTKGKIKE